MFKDEYRTDIFGNGLSENKKKFEQFFWTIETVQRLVKSFEYTYMGERCCLTTPSLAHAWYIQGQDEVCLDIDERFQYLPKYHFYDVREPRKIEGEFRIIILDPPYFVVPIEEFRKAVDVITDHKYDTKIIFLKREEKRLLSAFDDYKLKPTKFPLEYASIKPSKWSNFCLYSNVDLPGIKRQGSRT